ncbi:hypothetical protein JMA_27100 [Jeotgalibacillus malaysiensis]|uniref:Phage tail tape measure protein domain-containing protein n=1 Tax=Jeotgalibacillus malaysiensis TaxID=1508404 RepID=A0A0B5ATH8_9BACL|nr:phage tail tape measure protein [Jeotgalibacillus malaysiensis]AJD92027.1 hypothetical protein JMA_27100 [Jeotgalibacillus malaysiensis]
MAGKIKGITVEINGETSGLDKALKDVNKESRNLTTELKEVERGLKFDPKNTELLAQKQQILTERVETTAKKLDVLKQAQSDVNKQFERGDIDLQTYRNFNRHIETTEGVLKNLRADLDKTATSAKDAGIDFDKLGEKVKSAGDKVKNAGESVKGAGESLSAGVTLPLTALGTGAVMAANDVDSAQGRIQAQLGVTAEEAERLKGVAQDVWRGAFGENLQEVTDNLSMVKQNMGDLNDVDLKNVLESAYILQDAFGAELNESTRTASVLMKNFGVDSETAFDLMTTAFQRGGNFSDELLDTLREYAPQFQGMGYDAEEFTAILIAGAEAGAFNLDKVGDAAKESFLRIGDGSKASRDALEQLGLDVNQVETDINSGGESAQSAFAAVASAIAGVEDPAAKAQAAVALFGTPIEDLGPEFQDFFANVNTDLGEFEGATKTAGDALYDNFGTRMTEAFRGLQEALLPLGEILLDMAENLLPKISAAVQKVSEWFTALSPAAQQMTVIFGLIAAALGPVLVFIGALITGLGTMITTVGTAITWLAKLKPIFTAIRTAMLVLTGPVGIITAIVLGLAYLIYSNWESIKTWTVETWNFLAELLPVVWSKIKTAVIEGVTTAVSWIVTKWNEAKAMSQAILSAVVSTVVEKFTSIVSNVTQKMQAVKDWIQRKFEEARSAAVQKLADLVSNVITKFTSIVSNVQQKMQAAKDWVTNKFTEAKNSASQLISNIVTTVSSKFNSIVSSIRTKMTEAKNAVSNVWEGIKTVFRNSINASLDIVKNMGSRFKTAGRELVNMMADGIKGAVSKVTGAIEGVVSKVRDFLPFSPAKVGPLQDLDKLDFGNPIMDSLQKSLPQIQGMMGKVLSMPDMETTRNVVYSAGQNMSAAKSINTAPRQPAIIRLEVDGSVLAERSFSDLNALFGNASAQSGFMKGVRG